MPPLVLHAMLTAVFALLCGWSLVRAATAADRFGRTSHAVHAAAAAGLALLPWLRPLPIGLEVVVFTLGALWFVYLGLLEPGRGSASGVPPGGVRGRVALGCEVVGMVALVWLAVVLAPHGPAGTSGPAAPAASDGISALSTATAAGPPAWMAAVTIGVAVLCAVAAGWFAAQLLLPSAAVDARAGHDLNASAIRVGGTAFACFAVVVGLI